MLSKVNHKEKDGYGVMPFVRFRNKSRKGQDKVNLGPALCITQTKDSGERGWGSVGSGRGLQVLLQDGVKGPKQGARVFSRHLS